MSHKALSVKSRIGDVLKHPLGRDMLYRLSLQTGMRFSLVDNPLVRQMRLSLLPTLSGGKVDRSLLDSFLTPVSYTHLDVYKRQMLYMPYINDVLYAFNYKKIA